MSLAHILIVDDDPKIRLFLRRCLEPEGYRVSEAHDGKTMFSVLNAGPVDLITLDLTLASEDGLDLARRIPSVASIPIIVITGKGDAIDRIVGLELGADDYVSKPFHVREVLARVRSVLRRSQEKDLATAGAATNFRQINCRHPAETADADQVHHASDNRTVLVKNQLFPIKAPTSEQQ